MNRPVAWVTGAGGLIGNSLIQIAPEHAAGWTVLGLTRGRLDLTDFTAVRAAFAADQPQLVIHCAAISRSTDCEAEPARARQVNVDVTTRLSELATDIPFVVPPRLLGRAASAGHILELRQSAEAPVVPVAWTDRMAEGASRRAVLVAGS